MVGPADLDGTGLYLMAFHAVHCKQGVLRPRGGMSGLMRAFRICWRRTAVRSA